MTDLPNDRLLTIAAALIAVLLLAYVAAYARRKITTAAPAQGYGEIARITEEIQLTVVGMLGLFALVAHQLVCLAVFLGVKSAVQEASIGTLWIAGNVLFGLGVALGRHRTYRIWREIIPKAD